MQMIYDVIMNYTPIAYRQKSACCAQMCKLSFYDELEKIGELVYHANACVRTKTDDHTRRNRLVKESCR